MKARNHEERDRNVVANEAVINQRAEMSRSWSSKALPRAFLASCTDRPVSLVSPYDPRAIIDHQQHRFPAKPLARSQHVRVTPRLYNRTSSTLVEVCTRVQSPMTHAKVPCRRYAPAKFVHCMLLSSRPHPRKNQLDRCLDTSMLESFEDRRFHDVHWLMWPGFIPLAAPQTAGCIVAQSGRSTKSHAVCLCSLPAASRSMLSLILYVGRLVCSPVMF